jgi:hypothetical protein
LNFDNLPDNLRMAGVAWVVAESVRHGSEPYDVHLRAHHWAVMRGLPIATVEDHEAAAKDAECYAIEHVDEVNEFLAYRKREQERGRR